MNKINLRAGVKQGSAGKYGIHEKARFDRTVNFIGDRVLGSTLDIGETNVFSDWLETRFRIKTTNSSGDLNGLSWLPAGDHQFNTVFVFEVIEHLMNPLLFLELLSRRCDPSARVFLTYPAGNKIGWWSKMHFHEISRERFQVLLEHSPFESVRYERVFLWRDWKYIFFRVRPFLRYVVFGLRYQYYELRLKK